MREKSTDKPGESVCDIKISESSSFKLKMECLEHAQEKKNDILWDKESGPREVLEWASNQAL